jgi:hypothetical protein
MSDVCAVIVIWTVWLATLAWLFILPVTGLLYFLGALR